MSEKTSFSDLMRKISEQSDRNDEFTRDFMKELVHIIETALEKDGTITISGFGKFELHWMEERKGVHPQTQEEITIPAQNKVVFIPFKTLREYVNRPYARMQPQFLDVDPASAKTSPPEESEEEPMPESEIPDESQSRPPKKEKPDVDKAAGSDPEQKPEPADSDSTHKTIEEPAEKPDKKEGSENYSEEDYDPFGFSVVSDESKKTDQTELEKKVPPFPFHLEEEDEFEEFIEEDEDLVLIRPSPVKQKKPAVPFDEGPFSNEIQNEGRFRWSYLAAAVIILIIILALYYLVSSNEDATVHTVEVPAVETVPNPGVSEPVPADVEETELIAIIVRGGQNLWNLALDYLGNAYLWPWIYYLNSDLMDDPNIIYSGIDVTIPVPEDPDNLADEELREVALGYVSVYQWYRQNEPEEARNFLWAAGSFYPDILEQIADDVDQDDLHFARIR